MAGLNKTDLSLSLGFLPRIGPNGLLAWGHEDSPPEGKAVRPKVQSVMIEHRASIAGLEEPSLRDLLHQERTAYIEALPYIQATLLPVQRAQAKLNRLLRQGEAAAPVVQSQVHKEAREESKDGKLREHLHQERESLIAALPSIQSSIASRQKLHAICFQKCKEHVNLRSAAAMLADSIRDDIAKLKSQLEDFDEKEQEVTPVSEGEIDIDKLVQQSLAISGTGRETIATKIAALEKQLAELPSEADLDATAAKQKREIQRLDLAILKSSVKGKPKLVNGMHPPIPLSCGALSNGHRRRDHVLPLFTADAFCPTGAVVKAERDTLPQMLRKEMPMRLRLEKLNTKFDLLQQLELIVENPNIMARRKLFRAMFEKWEIPLDAYVGLYKWAARGRDGQDLSNGNPEFFFLKNFNADHLPKILAFFEQAISLQQQQTTV